MATQKGKTHNVAQILEQARSGSMTASEIRRHVKQMEDRGTPVALEAALELRALLQAEQGRKAVEAAEEGTPGSAKWAFSQLGAAQVTPYRWSGTTAEGRVVVALWDEPDRFDASCVPRITESPERLRATQRMPGVMQNRTAYFRDLEVAAAKHGGLVTAILATAVDINAVPRQRKAGSCRPWLNEDGSPVVLRIKNLDIRRQTYEFELAEPHKRPKCPFDRVATTVTGTEDAGD